MNYRINIYARYEIDYRVDFVYFQSKPIVSTRYVFMERENKEVLLIIVSFHVSYV